MLKMSREELIKERQTILQKIKQVKRRPIIKKSTFVLSKQTSATVALPVLNITCLSTLNTSDFLYNSHSSNLNMARQKLCDYYYGISRQINDFIKAKKNGTLEEGSVWLKHPKCTGIYPSCDQYIKNEVDCNINKIH